jgi:hypothetical protein
MADGPNSTTVGAAATSPGADAQNVFFHDGHQATGPFGHLYGMKLAIQRTRPTLDTFIIRNHFGVPAPFSLETNSKHAVRANPRTDATAGAIFYRNGNHDATPSHRKIMAVKAITYKITTTGKKSAISLRTRVSELTALLPV